MDDATSQIVAMRFETAETIFAYMSTVKEHLEKFGRPIAYYSDRHSIFVTTRNEDGIYQDTQFKEALNTLCKSPWNQPDLRQISSQGHPRQKAVWRAPIKPCKIDSSKKWRYLEFRP